MREGDFTPVMRAYNAKGEVGFPGFRCERYLADALTKVLEHPASLDPPPVLAATSEVAVRSDMSPPSRAAGEAA